MTGAVVQAVIQCRRNGDDCHRGARNLFHVVSFGRVEKYGNAASALMMFLHKTNLRLRAGGQYHLRNHNAGEWGILQPLQHIGFL